MTYIPAQNVDYEQSDVLSQILDEVKKSNLHLASMSGEEITKEDVDNGD